MCLNMNRKRFLNIGMIFVLVIAGFAHFIFPEQFMKAVPPWLLAPRFIVYLTGLMEFLFAFALLRKSTRPAAAGLLMVYFIVLLPAHIYVSMEGIEMFGVSHKGFLWLRTFLQSVFIWWAYEIKKESSS